MRQRESTVVLSRISCNREPTTDIRNRLISNS